MQGMRIKSHRNWNPNFSGNNTTASSWTVRPFSWRPPQTRPALALVPNPVSTTTPKLKTKTKAKTKTALTTAKKAATRKRTTATGARKKTATTAARRTKA